MGLGAALIPWKEDFSFDEALFRKGVRNLAEGGLKYVYIFGTAGEGYAVNDEEFTEITKTFIDELSGTDTTPIVGVICLSATQTDTTRVRKHPAKIGRFFGSDAIYFSTVVILADCYDFVVFFFGDQLHAKQHSEQVYAVYE